MLIYSKIYKDFMIPYQILHTFTDDIKVLLDSGNYVLILEIL